MIGERLPNTLLLMLTAEIVIIILSSIAIGLYSALRPYSWFDNIVTSLSFIGLFHAGLLAGLDADVYLCSQLPPLGVALSAHRGNVRPGRGQRHLSN